jgi:hypothetical protein
VKRQGIDKKHVGKLEGWNVEGKEVKSSKLKVESKEKMRGEWRRLVWQSWGRDFTTHDTVDYRIGQLHL